MLQSSIRMTEHEVSLALEKSTLVSETLVLAKPAVKYSSSSSINIESTENEARGHKRRGALTTEEQK